MLKKIIFVALSLFSAMNIFASFLVLLLILVEAAPPTAASVPSLGKCVRYTYRHM